MLPLARTGCIETERLLLRPFEETDAPDLFAYARDERVGPNAGWKPHDTIDESALIIKHFMEKEEVLALFHKRDARVIGSIGLHARADADDAREIGYVLSPDYWGMGLMTEAVRAVMKRAFVDMGIKTLSVGHFLFNDRSRRVIEKCGFKFEEIKLENFTRKHDGVKIDEAMYSITYDEWAAASNT